MKINRERTIMDLQLDFKKAFPYLKIEFFKTPDERDNAIDENGKLESHLNLEKISSFKNSGEFLLNQDMEVGDFESHLRQRFGLYVQVYRKERGKWLQSWTTDSWTLEQQNNRSRTIGDVNLFGV